MHRWEDNISMDLKEIGCVDVDWRHLTQSLLVSQEGRSFMELVWLQLMQ
jgi:hypothetical protein